MWHGSKIDCCEDDGVGTLRVTGSSTLRSIYICAAVKMD